MFVEENYQDLSRDVYRLDQKHGSYDPEIKEGAIRQVDRLKYKILKVEDNTTNGMQAMAVAPVENGKVDTSKIVIAYARTNFKDGLDIKTDLQTVISGNKDSLVDRQQIGYTSVAVPVSVESQISTAEKFAEHIRVDYPNANVTTTGHSLGEYIALYVSPENGWKNVGFNGPDPYEILSPEAKEWVKVNPGMLFNYRNKTDTIGNFGGNGTGAEVLVDMNVFRQIVDTIEYHRLSTWKFDDDGNVNISDSPENKEARLIRAEKQIHEKMNELSILQINLVASGGGLSSNEEIYLDNAQALLTVEFISQSMEIGLEYVKKIYRDAINEAEEIWENGLQLALSIGTELSYSEILNALEAGGITKYSVVFGPSAYYQEKITKALEIGEDFDLLASEIKASIEELEKTDKDLANQISQGA